MIWNAKFYILTLIIANLFINTAFANKENMVLNNRDCLINLCSPFDKINNNILFSDYYWNRIIDDMKYYHHFNSIKTNYLSQDKQYIITMEVPGYDKNQIKVKVSSNKLYIIGNIDNQKGDSSTKKNFSHTIAVPDDVEQKAISTTLKNGILTITLPRVELKEQNTKEIPIN